MVYLNVAATVTKAQSKIVDNSTVLRSKLVGWFNEVSRDIFNQPRDWEFLKATVTLPITNSQAQLPNGAAEIVAIEVGDNFLTRDNQFGVIDAYTYSNTNDNLPIGYTLSPSGLITFLPSAGYTDSYSVITYDGPVTYGGDVIPGAPTSCIVLYEADLNADYTDAATATIFPLAMEGLFVTGLRMHYYDYSKDGRFAKETALYDYEMKKIKEWDNRKKAQPKNSNHGYIRTRV